MYLTGDESYNQILTMAVLRLDDDRKAGGDRRILANWLEPRLQVHRPATPEVGEPCAECGEPWPCGDWKLALSPE